MSNCSGPKSCCCLLNFASVLVLDYIAVSVLIIVNSDSSSVAFFFFFLVFVFIKYLAEILCAYIKTDVQLLSCLPHSPCGRQDNS